eukprot:11213286-Lingulodinium_polyedra.AAC.1
MQNRLSPFAIELGIMPVAQPKVLSIFEMLEDKVAGWGRGGRPVAWPRSGWWARRRPRTSPW